MKNYTIVLLHLWTFNTPTFRMSKGVEMEHFKSSPGIKVNETKYNRE